MTIDPSEIRYIKLGRGGAWADTCFEKGEVQFGHPNVPHDLCLKGDWDGVKGLLIGQGHSPGTVTSFVREIRSFYTLGSGCLWFTFAHDHIWWTFAAPEVAWLGGDGARHGARSRNSLGGWQKTDVKGRQLIATQLSSRLTSTGSFRQTICEIKCEDYLRQVINGEQDPLVIAARAKQDGLVATAKELVKRLHWRDFENLVELIFARSGWQRVSSVGGTQANVDFEVHEPILNLRATAQVKSSAAQAQLDAYVAESRKAGIYDHLFFACHSPSGTLVSDDDETVHVWQEDVIASMAVKVGLYDWLLERAA